MRGMGVGRNFSSGGKRRHFDYNCRVADDAVQMDLHKTLYSFYTTKKMTHFTVTITKNALRRQRYPSPRYTTIVYWTQ